MNKDRDEQSSPSQTMALEGALRPNQFVMLSSGPLPLKVVRSLRARRYLLRLNPDRTVRLTVPRGGTLPAAQAFLDRNLPWLERANRRLTTRPTVPKVWHIGTDIYWRGERVPIQDAGNGRVLLGSDWFPIHDPSKDLRTTLESLMRQAAARELPPVVKSLAEQHAVSVRRVRIGNQRSRWGSCSRDGTVSLNWRILQAPVFVRDYLVLHELMHLREMNHSRRFWAHVAEVCPGYEAAERWLSEFSYLLQP